MPRILTKLRISEVSAVDRGAGDGVKIVLMKRDDDRPRSKPHVERHARRLRKFEDIFMRKQRDDEDDDDTDRDELGRNDGGGASDHHASKVADLLVEAGSFPYRAAALQHLLHKPEGQALLARTRKAADQTAKESNMRSETLESILKDGGPVSVCKAIVGRGRSPCGEQELVAALTKHAAEQFNMPGDRAFARLFEAEESVRRACAIAKAAPLEVASLTPVQVGGEDTRDLSDTSKAIEQLKQLGRDRWGLDSHSRFRACDFSRSAPQPSVPWSARTIAACAAFCIPITIHFHSDGLSLSSMLTVATSSSAATASSSSSNRT
jgi:hypothetical protein